MSKNSSSTTSGGTGFFGLLQVAFIVLKLCKVINWSWWLVLLPLWIELGLVAIILIIGAIIVISQSKKSDN